GFQNVTPFPSPSLRAPSSACPKKSTICTSARRATSARKISPPTHSGFYSPQASSFFRRLHDGAFVRNRFWVGAPSPGSSYYQNARLNATDQGILRHLRDIQRT